MALQDYIKEDFKTFDVVCVDQSFCMTDLTEKEIYTVLGMLQDFYIIKNDKNLIGKYYKTRFKTLEFPDEEEE